MSSPDAQRLEFARGTDIAEAANDLRAALDGLRDELPLEASAPRVFKLDLDRIEVVSLAVTSTRHLEEVTRLLEDELARRFEQIPGVGAIDVRGGIRREIRVELDDVDERHGYGYGQPGYGVTPPQQTQPGGGGGWA